MSNRPVILVCDDDPGVVARARRGLAQRYEVLSVSSGPEALVSLASHDVDVLVTDQRLHDMDGADICMRAAEISPRTKQVILTASNDFHDLRRACNSGRVVGCLEKPLRVDVLAELIERSVRDPVFITTPHPVLVPITPSKIPSWFKRSKRKPPADAELRQREADAEVQAAEALDELRATRQFMRATPASLAAVVHEAIAPAKLRHA